MILVDTDILIDVAHGVTIAIKKLEEFEILNKSLAICVITEMELLAGCRNKHELLNTQDFLTSFKKINLNHSICQQAVNLFVQYRLSHGIDIPDALIAACAINLNIPLLSKNQKDFRYIESLELLVYP